MAAYELAGTVKVVMDEVKFDSGFTKREFVVTTADGRYPQDIKFECVKDKTGLLAAIKPGQQVTVSFDIRGNEYNGRYFVNLSAWRIESAKSDSAPAGDGDSDSPPLDQLSPPEDGADSDSLPF
jgi:single-strand DNA-binding protein